MTRPRWSCGVGCVAIALVVMAGGVRWLAAAESTWRAGHAGAYPVVETAARPSRHLSAARPGATAPRPVVDTQWTAWAPTTGDLDAALRGAGSAVRCTSSGCGFPRWPSRLGVGGSTPPSVREATEGKVGEDSWAAAVKAARPAPAGLEWIRGSTCTSECAGQIRAPAALEVPF